ncbi:MAG: hypothetical protein AAB562_01180, partial [Patescibacteria group bacterium]
KDEIVTGAGAGGGPHVRVFTRLGQPQGRGFFAGNPAARRGVRVLTADLDGNGTSEILAATTDVFTAR